MHWSISFHTQKLWLGIRISKQANNHASVIYRIKRSNYAQSPLPRRALKSKQKRGQRVYLPTALQCVKMSTVPKPSRKCSRKKLSLFQFQWQFPFKSQYKLLLKDVVRQENFVIPASKHQRLNQSTWNR